MASTTAYAAFQGYKLECISEQFLADFTEHCLHFELPDTTFPPRFNPFSPITRLATSCVGSFTRSLLEECFRSNPVELLAFLSWYVSN